MEIGDRSEMIRMAGKVGFRFSTPKVAVSWRAKYREIYHVPAGGRWRRGPQDESRAGAPRIRFTSEVAPIVVNLYFGLGRQSETAVARLALDAFWVADASRLRFVSFVFDVGRFRARSGSAFAYRYTIALRGDRSSK